METKVVVKQKTEIQAAKRVAESKYLPLQRALCPISTALPPDQAVDRAAAPTRHGCTVRAAQALRALSAHHRRAAPPEQTTAFNTIQEKRKP